jgi:hypothetical protein
MWRLHNRFIVDCRIRMLKHPQTKESKMTFLEFMRGIMLGVVVLAVLFMLALVNAHASAPMSKAEIAKLPQDKVAIIKQHCARKWESNFDMRLFCEDNQYQALKTLLERE